MQKQHWIIFIGLLLLVTIVSTSTILKRDQLDCDVILNATIINTDFQTIPLENAKDWAITHFGSAEKNIETFAGHADGETIVQSFGEHGEIITKYLMFYENDDLVAINEGNRGDFSSIDAFECLGEPEYYDAYYGNSWGAVYLWYPDKGIMTEYFVAWNKDLFKDSPPIFSGKGLANIFYYQGDNLEQVATLVRSKSITNSVSFQLYPWPGWRQVEFDKIEE